MPRITYDYLKNLSPTELGKMKKAEIKRILKEARKKYEVRRRQLNKEASKVWSPALEKMEAYYDEGTPALSKISRNRALNEVMQIQTFLNAETSTVSGARKVMREQDIRIFGETSSGRPKHRMTVSQRTNFWSAYQEFLSQNKTSATVFGSNAIQQYLGELVINKGSIEISPEQFEQMLDDLREMGEETEYGYENANVFSGNWNPRNR